MTQRQLAPQAGTTQTHLSFIERGAVQPRAALQARLAIALRASVEDLFPPVPADEVARIKAGATS